MTTWVALLRGINVGGNNPLPMKELTTLLEGIGCSRVTTYIQSGNVLFERADSNARQLARLIGETIQKNHGFRPKVLLLSVKDLNNAAASNPFPDAEAEPKTLHLFFLSERPKSAELSAMDEIKLEGERYSLAKDVFYLHAPGGIAPSRLAAKAEMTMFATVETRQSVVDEYYQNLEKLPPME